MKLFQPIHLLVLLIPLLGALATLFWIWMIVECLRRKDLDESLRIRWAVTIALTYVFGAIAYFCWSRFLREPAGVGVAEKPDLK
jgi:hypothetical protein